MKTKVSPTIIGSFVIGAFALGVIAVLTFGGVSFFAKPQRFVVYFDESIHGLTLGSPILLLIENRDWENWTRVMQVEPLSAEDAAELAASAAEGTKRAIPVTRVRPGHADLAGALKYGFDDVRNVLERASARETKARVAAGGVAKALLWPLVGLIPIAVAGVWLAQ